MKEKKDMNDKMKDLQEKTAKRLDNADKKVNFDEMKNSDEMVGAADRKKRKRIRLAFCAAVAAVLIGTIGVFAAGNSSRVTPNTKSEATEGEKAYGNKGKGSTKATKVSFSKDTKTDSSSSENKTKAVDVKSETKEQETGSGSTSTGVTGQDAEKAAADPEKVKTSAKTITTTPNKAVSTAPNKTTTASPAKTPTKIPVTASTKAPTQATTQTPTAHNHNWVAQTVHHEAQTQQVYVIDQAAYDEPVYETRPVYTIYGVDVCNVCGADIEDIGEHGESHMDWDKFTNPFSYHYEERKVSTGEYHQVQIGSIHHDEVGHYETQVMKAAYDETVGYKCSCGATK